MSDRYVAQIKQVSLQYGKTHALRALSLNIPAHSMAGLIGPDGVGKSSLLALIAGARRIQQGQVWVLDGNMADLKHRDTVCPQIAYMPQGLGKNLYPTLTVFENLDFFGRLFGQSTSERQKRIQDLVNSTGLAPFTNRPAGKLSGGMKQKLGLCCALIHDPDLLILDEPTTGVDPLSRNQFWELITRIRHNRPSMSVLVATAYMDEAQRFDWLAIMDEGQVLASDTPKVLLQKTQTQDLEQAFIALLPEKKRQHHQALVIPPRTTGNPIAIEARHLTRRFGDFVAVNNVNFRIEQGEIFGFLGSNGCGKSTTMKMLTGLLPFSEGEAFLFGNPVDPNDLNTRQRVGYMSQGFSLYSELSVRQNLELHAKLFQIPPTQQTSRIQEMLSRFDLNEAVNELPSNLPLGVRQRLSLAVAVIHRPELLILDEPTSGVDPIARDNFWALLVHMSREEGVTIFVSTHFMNEALRCDRISLMHAGQVLDSDSPQKLIQKRGLNNLEETFIAYLKEAQPSEPTQHTEPHVSLQTQKHPLPKQATLFSFQRLLSYSLREGMELRRDPVRAVLALIGTMLLMLIMGYGINMDVENLSFAAWDQDQTTTSQNYLLNISGSRYFTEKSPLHSYSEIEQRLQQGDISMAIEIPPNFGRDLKRGNRPSVGIWVDGAMPTRAETIKGYIQGIHTAYLDQLARDTGTSTVPLVSLALRYRYNPDVQSIPAMVPAMIPLLLMMIPAMLTALSVVREKELGSITNFYVTPVTRLEFLLGKQIPYVTLGMINFGLLILLAVYLFNVPLKGSLLALSIGAFLYVCCSTGLGLLISSVLNSQIAAIFGTAIATMLPALQFSGLFYPVSSLEGAGAFFGNLYPTTHFLTISRGVFSKALGLQDLYPYFFPLLLLIPVLTGLSVAGLRKQER